MQIFTIIENTLSRIFLGVPALSLAGRQALVRVWPYVAIVAAIVQVIALVVLIGLAVSMQTTTGSVNTYNGVSPEPFSGVSAGEKFVTFSSIAVTTILAVLYFGAVPALIRRRKAGWNIVYTAVSLGFLYNLALLFDKNTESLSSLLAMCGAIVGLYILFQIRDQYKPRASR